MAAPSSKNMKLSKEQKKLLRKQIKAQHILLKQDGISTVSGPTNHLVIANGGLGNGVSRQQLNEVLQEFGTVETLLMLPHKPHAFATYSSIQEAREAYSALNGRNLKTDGNTKPITLYLNFVEEVVSKDVSPLNLPPGLLVIEEIISPDYEKRLLEFVDRSTVTTQENVQRALKHRRVKHYGYEFRYDNNKVDKDKPLPGGLPEICDNFLEQCLEKGYVKFKPDQLTINQYEPGQGIPPHVDTHSPFEDGIICLSLGAETVMDFKHPNGRSVAVMLPRCSLLVMTGESRYLWSHGSINGAAFVANPSMWSLQYPTKPRKDRNPFTSLGTGSLPTATTLRWSISLFPGVKIIPKITPRKFDVVPASDLQKTTTISGDISNLTLNKRGTRTSFTFRKIRMTPCDCAYPEVCDSQICCKCRDSPPSVPSSNEDASKLEHKYVHDVYDEIAGHFSSTRHTPWPKVTEFLKALPAGAFVVDVGCGNGKYLGVNKDLFMVGCDRSKNLADICRERKFEVFICDALHVPLRSGVCDACISIAVVHHFSTEGRRLSAIKEIVRILRPGGKGLIYVWAMEQEQNKVKSKYLMERKEKTIQSQKNCNAMPTVDEDQDTSKMDLACFNQLADVNGTVNKQNSAKLHIHINRTSFESQDLLVPWHLKDGVKADSVSPLSPTGPKELAVFHRYYHIFSDGDLENICRSISNIRIVQSYYDQGNWCVVIEKY